MKFEHIIAGVLLAAVATSVLVAAYTVLRILACQ